MQIKLKATGRLKKYLTSEVIESGDMTLEKPGTLAELIGFLQIPDNEPFAFIVNNTMVPHSKLTSTDIRENDEITLIPPIRGG